MTKTRESAGLMQFKKANGNNFNGSGFVCQLHFLPDELIKTKRVVKLKKSVIPSQFFVEYIEQIKTEEQKNDRCHNCEELIIKIQEQEPKFEIERFKLLDVIKKLKNDKMNNLDHIRKLKDNVMGLNGKNVFLEKMNANLKANLLCSDRNSGNNNVSKFLDNLITQHFEFEKLFIISVIVGLPNKWSAVWSKIS